MMLYRRTALSEATSYARCERFVCLGEQNKVSKATEELIWEIAVMAGSLLIAAGILRLLRIKPPWWIVILGALIGKALWSCWA